MKNDHRSKFSNLSNWKEEAWKNQGFNGIRTRDLCDTGAMLYQLSHEATHWERGQSIEFISSRLLRWWFFTFIYNHSSNMNYFIHTSHHFTPHGKMWAQLIDLAPNVQLHSSVGRASHRYRGGHGFESRWSPDFFQASSFQLLKKKITAMIILHFHI